MHSAILLLLPLAMAVPTPQGFSTGLATRSLTTCSPTICDPPNPDFSISYGPIIKDPPIVGCDPQICDPPEFGLDTRKRSPTLDPSSYTGISAKTLASARSVEQEPDTGPADYGNGLGRRSDVITKGKKGWIPDRDGLVKDESQKLKSKRALEPLSPDSWGVVDSGTGVNNGVVKRADRTTVIVSNWKRAVDGEVDREAHTGIGSGIVIGSKDKRKASESTFVGNGIVIGSKDKREGLAVTVGGGGGIPRDTVSDIEEGGVVGNGIVIGSKLKLKREADGGTVSGGSSHPRRRTDDDEESGGIIDNGIVTGSKLKRDDAEKPHWGDGNSDAVQKRSITGVGSFLDETADSEAKNGVIIVFSGKAEDERRSDVSVGDQVESGATVVFANPEANEKRSDESGSDRVSSGSNTVFFSPEENEKRSDGSGIDRVSSGSNTVYVNPEADAKRSGVSIGNQVE